MEERGASLAALLGTGADRRVVVWRHVSGQPGGQVGDGGGQLQPAPGRPRADLRRELKEADSQYGFMCSEIANQERVYINE